jgi:hypothetical protein
MKSRVLVGLSIALGLMFISGGSLLTITGVAFAQEYLPDKAGVVSAMTQKEFSP